MSIAAKKEVLLIVEDYDAIRNALGRFFANEGYNVISTGSLENALRLGREEAPEVIVLDYHMRVDDPTKVISLLHLALPDSTLVVMNGNDLKDKEKILRLGAQAVFVRSYDVTEFEKVFSTLKQLSPI